MGAFGLQSWRHLLLVGPGCFARQPESSSNETIGDQPRTVIHGDDVTSIQEVDACTTVSEQCGKG